jgi:hypothetical protein
LYTYCTLDIYAMSIVESSVRSRALQKLALCESISQGLEESRPDFRILKNTAYLFEMH